MGDLKPFEFATEERVQIRVGLPSPTWRRLYRVEPPPEIKPAPRIVAPSCPGCGAPATPGLALCSYCRLPA